MPKLEDLDTFIERCKKEMLVPATQNELENFNKRKKYNDSRNKTEIHKLQKLKYEKSEKGRVVRRRRNSLRNDTEEIKEFYRNRPVDCHVDHIIPLSKGGQHVIENLQYLKVTKNANKAYKVTTDTKIAFIRNKILRHL